MGMQMQNAKGRAKLSCHELYLTFCLSLTSSACSNAWERVSSSACKNTHLSLFECFPYVCPEPVLVK